MEGKFENEYARLQKKIKNLPLDNRELLENAFTKVNEKKQIPEV